jgi:hypothetical protein
MREHLWGASPDQIKFGLLNYLSGQVSPIKTWGYLNPLLPSEGYVC